MTKYRIKKCKTSKSTWYEVEYTKWWYFGLWRNVMNHSSNLTNFLPRPMKFKTEEEASYKIKTLTKKKEPVIVTYNGMHY